MARSDRCRGWTDGGRDGEDNNVTFDNAHIVLQGREKNLDMRRGEFRKGTKPSRVFFLFLLHRMLLFRKGVGATHSLTWKWKRVHKGRKEGFVRSERERGGGVEIRRIKQDLFKYSP